MYYILLLIILIILLFFIFKYNKLNIKPGYNHPLINNIENFNQNNNVPDDPNDYSCYNYLKKYKNWDVDSLSSDQKKVLFTLKAGLTDSYDNNILQFMFTNSCIIPQNHFDIYNIQLKSNNTCDINIDPSLQNDSNYKPVKTSYNLPYTSTKDYPNGIKINLDDDNITFDKFKDILNGLYQQFDKEYIINRKTLLNKINTLNAEYDNLVTQNTNTVNDINHVNSLINGLNDLNSECVTKTNSYPSYQSRKDIYNNYASYIDSKNIDVKTRTNEIRNKINGLINC